MDVINIGCAFEGTQEIRKKDTGISQSFVHWIILLVETS